MKARLISIMLWAPDDYSDDHVAQGVRDMIDDGHEPMFSLNDVFIKSVTIAPDQVAAKAAIIFGETIEA